VAGPRGQRGDHTCRARTRPRDPPAHRCHHNPRQLDVLPAIRGPATPPHRTLRVEHRHREGAQCRCASLTSASTKPSRSGLGVPGDPPAVLGWAYSWAVQCSTITPLAAPGHLAATRRSRRSTDSPFPSGRPRLKESWSTTLGGSLPGQHPSGDPLPGPDRRIRFGRFGAAHRLPATKNRQCGRVEPLRGDPPAARGPSTSRSNVTASTGLGVQTVVSGSAARSPKRALRRDRRRPPAVTDRRTLLGKQLGGGARPRRDTHRLETEAQPPTRHPNPRAVVRPVPCTHQFSLPDHTAQDRPPVFFGAS